MVMHIAIAYTSPIKRVTTSSVWQCTDWLFSTKSLSLKFCLLLCVFTPLLVIANETDRSILTMLPMILSQACIFATALFAYAVTHRTLKSRYCKHLTAFSLSASYTLLLFALLFWIQTNISFDIVFFVRSFREVVPTTRYILGEADFYTLIGTLMGSLLLLHTLFLRSWPDVKRLHLKNWRHELSLLCICVLCSAALFPVAYGDLYISLDEKAFAKEQATAVFPSNSHYSTGSRDSVFILQLESINALLVNGQVHMSDSAKDTEYIPNLKTIATDGIYLPYFWSNAVMTNRAFESIFCGVVANMQSSFAYRPYDIANICLPALLRQSGYKTIAYRSSDLGFSNMGNFLQELGFGEVHQQDIMQSQDTRYEWGYDDCTFYERIFEDLQNNQPDKDGLFVFTEVSAHHYPFHPRDGYTDVEFFPGATDFKKQYANSLRIQDHCVKVFYENYKKFANERTHLFIISDTSWPVGVNENNVYNLRGAYNDNFLTPLVYIPPGSSQETPSNVTETIFAQTDILPTIFGLLNKEQYANSFASALTGAVSQDVYEECHVLSQPYDSAKLAVVQGDKKYIYSFADESVTFFDLSTDWLEQHPTIIKTETDFKEFKEEYFCERYKA